MCQSKISLLKFWIAGWVLSLATSRDSQTIVTGSYDLSINSYDIESKMLNYTIEEAHDGKIGLKVPWNNVFVCLKRR